MIEIIDIGASPFEEVAPYEQLVTLGLAHVTGFEPDPAAFAELRSDKNRTYHRCAVGDGWKHHFFRYKASGFSSLLPLRDDAVALLPEAKDWMQLLGTDTVQTEKLDNLHLPCDYLKMDCQGSELMILQNAQQTLQRTVLIHLEVSFLPLYISQPTLGDLDHELRRQGFLPRNVLSTHVTNAVATIDADMLYVRREPTEAQEHLIAQILENCYPQCRR